MKRIAEAVLKEIWQAIREGKLDKEGHRFETVSGHMGSPQDIDIKVKSRRGETVLTFIGIANKSLAEKVTGICNLVANNLRKGDIVQQLDDEADKMKEASDELREMLNPVKLRPMILRTRCDLCPV